MTSNKDNTDLWRNDHDWKVTIEIATYKKEVLMRVAAMKDGRIGHTIDCEEAWFFHLECSSGFATLVLVVFVHHST